MICPVINVPLCLNQGKNGKDGEPGPAGSDGGPVSGYTGKTRYNWKYLMTQENMKQKTL